MRTLWTMEQLPLRNVHSIVLCRKKIIIPCSTCLTNCQLFELSFLRMFASQPVYFLNNFGIQTQGSMNLSTIKSFRMWRNVCLQCTRPLYTPQSRSVQMSYLFLAAKVAYLAAACQAFLYLVFRQHLETGFFVIVTMWPQMLRCETTLIGVCPRHRFPKFHTIFLDRCGKLQKNTL